MKAKDIELNPELIHDYKAGDKLNLQLSQFPDALTTPKQPKTEGED